MMTVAGGPRVWMVAIVAAVLLAISYWNGLDGAFVFDDEPSLVSNQSIRSLWPLSQVLWTKGEIGRTHDGRPLVNLSFAISYAVHGLWKPGLRICNLLVHLTNACLVFAVVERLLELSQKRLQQGDGIAEAGRDSWLAAAIAVLWAVHPLHTHVNTYIVQRAESLAATFILGAFLVAIAALDRGSLAAAGLAAMLAALGGLAKETTAAILPLVAAFDWAYHDRLAAATDSAHRQRARAWLYAGLAANPLVILGTMVATGGRGASAGFGTAPVFEYFLTQCNAVWLYLGRILWPRTLILDHGDGLATLATAWPWLMLTLAALAVIAIGFWYRPRLFFPAVAAVLLLAPSSSIVPIATQTIAEHRAYLMSVAVIGFLLMGVVAVIRRAADAETVKPPRLTRIVAGAVVAILVVACVARTILRNRDFATAATVWTQNVRDCPGNPRALRNLAELFTLDQRYDIATEIYRQALPIPELTAYAACGMGDALRRQQKFAEARDAYQRAIETKSPPSGAQFAAIAGLAAAELGLDAPHRALALVSSLHEPPWPGVAIEGRDRWKTIGRGHVYQASALRRTGRVAAARESLDKAIAFARAHPAAAEAIARACDDMREFAAAATIWEPLAAADPSLLANLAVSRIEAGQIEGAINAFRRAVAAYPNDPRMRENLARGEAIAKQAKDTNAPAANRSP